MTDDEVHDAIAGDAEVLALVQVGDDHLAAALLSSRLPPRFVSRVMNEASVMRVLGPVAGDAALSAIEAAAEAPGPFSSILQRVVRQLHSADGGIDVGEAVARDFLDQLVGAGVLQADWVAAIKADAQVPQMVGTDQVSAAWLRNRPGGKVGG